MRFGIRTSARGVFAISHISYSFCLMQLGRTTAYRTRQAWVYPFHGCLVVMERLSSDGFMLLALKLRLLFIYAYAEIKHSAFM